MGEYVVKRENSYVKKYCLLVKELERRTESEIESEKWKYRERERDQNMALNLLRWESGRDKLFFL